MKRNKSKSKNTDDKVVNRANLLVNFSRLVLGVVEYLEKKGWW